MTTENLYIDFTLSQSINASAAELNLVGNDYDFFHWLVLHTLASVKDGFTFTEEGFFKLVQFCVNMPMDKPIPSDAAIRARIQALRSNSAVMDAVHRITQKWGKPCKR